MSAAPFTILIDGACPLCRREGAFMRRLDKGRGRLRFVDIADEAFDASAFGASRDELMRSIHGVTPEGEIVRGMEAFRLAYASVGWGWLLAPTGWPLIRPVADLAYRWFAANRLRLTGRAGACHTGACGAPSNRRG